MSEKKKTKREELDRSIDLGMDQFGRFTKRAWLWIVLITVVPLFIFFVLGQQFAVTLATGFFQIAFAVIYIVIQFAALFWFLGRPRLYWVMPGETGVTFDDYKGNPEVLESARRIVRLLEGTPEFREMVGQPVRGRLLTGPPWTGKSYLAQLMSTESGGPVYDFRARTFRDMFISLGCLL